jgi:HNH endonuclease
MMSRRERERYVETRAAGRCEYCRIHQSLQGATFHVEHVVPQSRGGHSQLDNLARACPSYNLHKVNRVEALDPDTGNQAPLFHLHSDHWEMHFRWDGYELVGQTPSVERPLLPYVSIIFDASRFAKLKNSSHSSRHTISAHERSDFHAVSIHGRRQLTRTHSAVEFVSSDSVPGENQHGQHSPDTQGDAPGSTDATTRRHQDIS